MTILLVFYYKGMNFLMNLETLVVLDECLLSNDNKLDQTKQQMTAKKKF